MRLATSLGMAALSMAAAIGPAMGQVNPYYDSLSGAEAAEVQSWCSMYLLHLDTGTSATGAVTFQFTDARMNSPLFSPLSAAVRTAAMATTGDVSTTCLEAWQLVDGAPASNKLAPVVRSYMLERKISTNPSLDPDAATAHLLAVNTAQKNGYNVILTTEGNDLVSYGLPETAIPAFLAGEGVYADIDVAEAEWLGALAAATPGIAAQIDHSTANRRQLLGGKTVLAEFQLLVNGFLTAHGYDADVTTFPIEAWFGAYGSLPILMAISDDGFVLIDATTGAMDGPFVPGSVVDPSNLLAAHDTVYMEGSSVVVVSAESLCQVVAAPTWRNTPPPGWTPTPPTPGAPPTTPPGRTTNWTDYRCFRILGGRCRCESTGTGTGGTPPATIRTRVTCYCSPANGTDCTPPGNPGHPNIPPGAITPPGTLTGCSCTQQWFY